jgi:hypothetical protein
LKGVNEAFYFLDLRLKITPMGLGHALKFHFALQLRPHEFQDRSMPSGKGSERNQNAKRLQKVIVHSRLRDGTPMNFAGRHDNPLCRSILCGQDRQFQTDQSYRRMLLVPERACIPQIGVTFLEESQRHRGCPDMPV